MEPLEHIIAAIPEKTPPCELMPRILLSVREARDRSVRMHRILFGVVSATSGISLVPAFIYAAREFSTSAFASYLSLLFSDTGIALANWKSLGLSLVESAPVFGLTVAVAVGFVFLASLKALAPYLRKGRFSYQFS